VVVGAGAIAVVSVALVVRRFYDDDSAIRAAALFSFFPGAYTLSLLYSEGFMVAAVLVAFLALYRRRWVIAGLAGAVAAFSRPTGIAIVVACAWETMRAVRERREWRALWATALPPLGVLAYFAYLWQHTGELKVYFRVQRDVWFDKLSLGPSLRYTLGHLFDPSERVQRLILFVALVFIVIAAIALVRSRLALSMKLYAAAVLALPVLFATVGARPRYVFVAFPLIAAVGVKVSGRAFAGLLTLSTVGMVWLLVVYVQRSPELAHNLYPILPSP
jgi:Gpi18-like mannosyltransferase